MVYVCQDVMRQVLQRRKVMMWNDKLKIEWPVVTKFEPDWRNSSEGWVCIVSLGKNFRLVRKVHHWRGVVSFVGTSLYKLDSNGAYLVNTGFYS